MSSKPLAAAYLFCPQCSKKNATPSKAPFVCECGFANYFGPVTAVGALVVNENGELLLVRRAKDPGKGKWGLPGGFVDAGETGEKAVTREVLEETSLRVEETEYLLTSPNQYDYKQIVTPVIDIFYMCKVSKNNDIHLADGELDHFEWTHPSPEHLRNFAFESNRLAVEHWLKNR